MTQTLTPPTYLEYLEFSDLAYDMTADFSPASDPVTAASVIQQQLMQIPVSSPVPTPSGYALLDGVQYSSGLTAVAFKNANNQIVIAYRGSQPSLAGLWKDWVTADFLHIVPGVLPQAFVDAQTFANLILQANPGCTLYVTGHSLGGGEAEYVAAELQTLCAGAVTFAAPGVSEFLTSATLATDPVVTNFVNKYDPIGNYTLAGSHVGTTVVLPASLLYSSLFSGGLLGATVAAVLFHPLGPYGLALLNAGSIATDPLTLSTGGYEEPTDLSVLYPGIKNVVNGADGYGNVTQTGTVTASTASGAASVVVVETVYGPSSKNPYTLGFQSVAVCGDISASQAVTINAQGSVTGDSTTLDGLVVQSSLADPASLNISSTSGIMVAIPSQKSGNEVTFVAGTNGTTAAIVGGDTSSTAQTAYDFTSAATLAGTLSVSNIGSGGIGVTMDIQAGDDATLSADSSISYVSQDFDFGGATGTLTLVPPYSFAGTIYGFQPGDTIDLSGFGTSAAAASFGASDTLTITPPVGTVVSLNLDPSANYGGESFLFISDGASGTDIIAESDTQPIAFNGTGELLLVPGAGSLSGVLSGFQAGDIIDLSGISAAVASLSGSDVLNALDTSGHVVASISLSPGSNYAGEFFEAAADGKGGTAIAVGTVAITPFKGLISETDGPVSVTLTRSGNISAAATAYVSTTDGSTVAGEAVNSGDFVPLSYQPATFAAGSASATVSLTVNDVGITGKGNKTFGLDVTGAPGAGANQLASAQFTIDDNDEAANFKIVTIPLSSGFEGQAVDIKNSGIAVGYYGIGNYADAAGIFQFNVQSGGVTYVNAPKEMGYIFVSGAVGVAGTYQGAQYVTTSMTEQANIDELRLLSNSSGAVVSNVSGGESLPFLCSSGNYSLINPAPNGPLLVDSFNNMLVYDVGSPLGGVEFPGVIASVAAINDSGEVAGSVGAFTPDASYNSAIGNNESNEVYGTYSSEQPYTYINGNYTTIDIPNAIGGIAEFLNDAGDVAGYYYTSGLTASESVFLDHNGTLSTLTASAFSSLGPEQSMAVTALGADGEVVGEYENASQLEYAFIWKNGSLSTLGGYQNVNFDMSFINSGGVLAGEIAGSTTGSAVIYNNGTLQTIKLPPGGSFFDYGFDIVVGLNKSGEVAGDFTASGTAYGYAYANGVFTQVAVPGASDTYLTSLDDSGQIGGYYVDAAGDHSFVGLPDVACFLEGTEIMLQDGPFRVERLAVADVIRGQFHGPASIRWIGHRRVDCRRHPKPTDVWPIRVQEGAFGPGLPKRDLWLSPDHAVFAEGVLIPIKHLVNGLTIVQEPRDEVTYWHVELERHDVILAEGLPCESYLDTGNRGAFANAAQTMLHPVFAVTDWDEACAPLCVSGPKLVAARAQLLARLPVLGYRRVSDVKLCVAFEGRAVRAVCVVGRSHRFLLPAGARDLRIRSVASMIAGIDPRHEDRRPLGVRVDGITVNGCMIPLDSPRLGAGFYPIESKDSASWRWTDGEAVLTLDPGNRPVVLELCVGDTLGFWEQPRSAMDDRQSRPLHMTRGT